MDKLIPLVVPALLSCFLGIGTALITTNYKLKKQLRLDKEKENDRIRIKYLHPLLVAAEDLLERMVDIRRRRTNEEERKEMMDWFKNIKEKTQSEPFNFWANDRGYFALSSLYMTDVYFSYAAKIRREFPFIELNPGDNKTLLHHIKDVRISFGGKFGIWENIQDSLGIYLLNKTDETVKTYREFCEYINHQSEAVWFNRLIDFFRDVDKKLEDQFENIESSLKSLIDFLGSSLGVKRTEFQLTEQTLRELKDKHLPPDVVGRLRDIQDVVYRSEVDLFIALARLIGQNNVDDYKPSILRHAKKRQI